MPVTEHDELFARAEAELAAESGPSGMHYGDSTKRELYEALRAALAAQADVEAQLVLAKEGLRAALAAQPQPDELERLRNCVKWAAETLPCTDHERDLLRQAMAGSATPTGDNDE